MYKIELEFDTEKIPYKDIDEIGYMTDQIFEQEEIRCAENCHGRRVYLDRGNKQDYGKFWAAIFALKNNSRISNNLKTCFWYNGEQKENLINDLIRN